MTCSALPLAALVAVLAAPPLHAAVTGAGQDAADVFDSGVERSRFLAAAGVDGELDEAEFKANAAAADPFVRTFDSWPAMKSFDKNGNDTLDWFEAESYRKALRDATVAAYDKNKDGQLDEAERALAARDRAVGKAPRVVGGAGNDWDKNGNGRVDPDETEAYSKAQRQRYEQWQADYLRKWDTDGDGKLSEQESKAAQKAAWDEWAAKNPEHAAAYEKQREQWRKQNEQFIRKYDTNGNGALDPDEWKTVNDERMKAWKERDPQGYARYEKQQEQWKRQQEEQLTKYDANGNGKLDPQEWKAISEDNMKAWKKQQEELLQRYDANGDGRLDGDEWKVVHEARMKEWKERDPDGYAVYEKQMAAWKQQQEEYVKKHDTDGDGKLSRQEQEAAWKADREKWQGGQGGQGSPLPGPRFFPGNPGGGS